MLGSKDNSKADTGRKKDCLISFRVGEKFKNDLTDIAKAKGLNSLSDLVAEYVIEKYTQDYQTLLMIQLKELKTVRELLDKS